jgi:hypothetical protein
LLLFCLGELYHGERTAGSKVVTFTIRVYPFVNYQLRTQEKCSQIVQALANSAHQGNNIPNNEKKKITLKKTKKKAKKKSDHGHLGKSLRDRNLSK